MWRADDGIYFLYQGSGLCVENVKRSFAFGERWKLNLAFSALSVNEALATKKVWRGRQRDRARHRPDIPKQLHVSVTSLLGQT